VSRANDMWPMGPSPATTRVATRNTGIQHSAMNTSVGASNTQYGLGRDGATSRSPARFIVSTPLTPSGCGEGTEVFAAVPA
jgi:hypothetical protein